MIGVMNKWRKSYKNIYGGTKGLLKRHVGELSVIVVLLEQCLYLVSRSLTVTWPCLTVCYPNVG